MKSYLQFFAVLTILFITGPIFAQPYTITSHTEKDSCYGNFVFKTTSQLSGSLSVTTFFGDGSSSTNASSYMSAIGITHHYGLPGSYIVKHVLRYNSTPVDSVQFSITTTMCTFAAIRIYNDQNSNCNFDAGETNCWQGSCHVAIDSAGINIDTVLVNGYLQKSLTPGKTYTFHLLDAPTGMNIACPANGMVTVTLPSTLNTTNVDFGVQCGSTSSCDMAVTNIYGKYRPTSYSYIVVSAKDMSCSNQTGTLTATISNKFTYFAASPTPSSVSGNTVTWTIPNLSSLGVFYGFIEILPASPLSFTLGDTICSTATISAPSGDVNIANNNKGRCDTVVASFDPNSKEVTPAGAIVPGTKLDYTIHFENTGTDTAFNIYVLDTLPAYVDAHSFQMISSSHRTAASVFTGAGGKKIVRFEMPDIKLPDSSHHEANKGFVSYSINAMTGLAKGTKIENRAGIYFDVNPVVMTDYTKNWINYLNVTKVAQTGDVQVYPNPNKGLFIIKNDNNKYDKIRITNTLGQEIFSGHVRKGETAINVGNQPGGVYYIIESGKEGHVVRKIIIE